MYKSNSDNEVHVCIGSMVEIAQIRRTIAHMEADIAFHHSQTRMFEKMLKDEQKKLGELVSNHEHSSCEGESSDV